ncbi:neuropeptide SIFamide [Atheta coriaria]|uniref:neuropeptide SIFamide n=1 Tax=Dalotia coriaria TaxID=877792 RepID=UPI0031F4038F
MMASNLTKVFLVIAFALLIAGMLDQAEATYRKPPFNGSIFGKRGLNQDYDAAGKTLSAMCELASEACQAWFPQQEK